MTVKLITARFFCQKTLHLMALAASLLVLLPGCAPRPSEQPLPMDMPTDFSAAGEVPLERKWWRAFDDAQLDALMAEALDDNFELTATWYRLRQARAVAERASSRLFPDLEFEGAAEWSEGEGEGVESLQLGLVSAYEVDLWGRIDSAVEAERLRATASVHDFRTAALSLSAEVARTWYALLTAEAERELLEEQLATDRNIVSLMEDRFRRGSVSSVDLLRQRQQVEAARERIIVAESRIAALEHLLATLLGRTPGNPPAAGAAALPELPPLPQTGIPAELVQRRPDIRRAYSRLLAAERDLAAAIARQYPRLSLTASLSDSAASAGELFDDWLAALGFNLLAPLFDGGRREAEVARFASRRSELLYRYGQATLIAFREVEDGLVRERKQHERLASIEAQLELAEKASSRLQSLYFNGAAEYIDVLNARSTAQRLRRQRLTARGDLLELRIGLYRALAGGVGAARPGEASSGATMQEGEAEEMLQQ